MITDKLKTLLLIPLCSISTFGISQTTYNYTGAMDTYTVPAGVTSIHIEAWGAEGNNGTGIGGGTAGLGGFAEGDLIVTGGQIINLYVGGQDGYNGGGLGGATNVGNGGGASDVRVGGVTPADRVIVAGGGGGGGGTGCATDWAGGNGGSGGGLPGMSGADSPNGGGGFGGTLSTGGAAGIGCAGFLGNPGLGNGTGGDGQVCCCPTTPSGGGGGGGYAVGGGGGGGSAGTTGCSGNDKGGGGGGAGGSNFTGTLSNPIMSDSIQTGHGVIIISENCSASAASLTASACYSYTSPSGNYTWTSSNTYMDTIPNMTGCDSVLTIAVTINDTTYGAESITACGSYTWSNGMTYSSSGSYNDTLVGALTCDSIATLNLTINTVDATATQTGPLELAANASGATYQWIDCDNNDTPIAGETAQTFTATYNGNYAVIVTENGCSDTSACLAITEAAVIENGFGTGLSIFPNPTSGDITIDLDEYNTEVTIVVTTVLGQEVSRGTYNGSKSIELNLDGSTGYYFVEISAANGKKARVKVLKK